MADSTVPTSTPTPTSRRAPRALEYVRTEASAARRWMRNTWTRENLWSAIKTFAWVAPLTVLIWVYAEREQVVPTDKPRSIPIELTSGDATRIVTLVRPAEKMVMVDFQGPRSRVQAVEAALTRGGISPLTIVLDATLTPQKQHELNAVEVINSSLLLRQNGVIATNCQPPILTVYVDEYQEIELPVQAPASVTNLVSPPVFDPPRVRVRAPQGKLQEARENGALIAEADIANLPELKTPGSHEIALVRVNVPRVPTEHLTITPSTVKATLEVRPPDETFVIPSLGISVVMPAFFENRYNVECPLNIPNVKVAGPPERIQQIRDGQYPKALLEISREDEPLPDQQQSEARTRALRFIDLPEGVRVVTNESPVNVNFKLIRRSTDQ